MTQIIIISIMAAPIIIGQRHILVYRSGNGNDLIPILQGIGKGGNRFSFVVISKAFSVGLEGNRSFKFLGKM
ncbi:hypothetical protein [Algoriphagus persicinus]|uniref:hypothetical protein n=1 Tax=Algoriphagus persicinus TaxID=3108754 RepID=UPI002B36CFBA|nr:hypothetical protein [Algoriphagus sp. E1-3-M2]MEB2787310.1 hypothetical protein [Algoriphagus sp. E1-3-M2]